MANERTEKLAIDVNDLTRIPASMRVEIIPHVDLETIHRVGQGEKNEPVPAVEFKCPLLQAAMICDLIRSHDRAVKARPASCTFTVEPAGHASFTQQCLR